MNRLHLALLVALAAFTAGAGAQFVKGNEAVRTLASGHRQVETPPTAGAVLASPCLAARPGCGGGAWAMVETDTGLMECTEIYARPGTCRPSSYGARKLSRLWIVKTRGEWKQCQYPDLSSRCVSPKALPFSAVQ